ncbi:toxin-antitoxin system YwqK family antitoxin [Mucilaginibacter myungsuensis]|uniref:Antitoxin component YwqK of YwqJK toxin-antitoxin module n=1 Tax=Mucilaginibacter myungsuensis TaxID=649104 RepID=A0A929KX71_9SPHI|nr:hypothetical protein [Mucilaginibacter myungsuensis]MBE9660554.1 hypothetical protein [Mucilaginibacter myungsuensis]MDN3600599.1 hypothetical protein [Mucilaginibacter myungsuensis]
MKLLLTLLCSFITTQAYCCWCEGIKPFKNKEDLKGYQAIALVRIDDLGPVDSGRITLRKTPNVKVTVLEQFKGEPTTLFVDPGFNTTCNLGLEVGEVWLFFGIVYEGKMSVFSCDHTTKYQDADGYRDWFNTYTMEKLALLRDIYQHPSSTVLSKILCPNGKTEVSQHFKNGRLDGKRNIWYPTGIPFITEEFNNGIRTGHRLIYSPSGQLIRDVTYRDNLIAKAVSYLDTGEASERIKMRIMLAFDHKDSLFNIHQLDSMRTVNGRDKQLQQVYEYSADGRSYIRKSYKVTEGMSLEERLDMKEEVYEIRVYYPNGNLKLHRTSYNKLNQEIERSYANNGTSKEVAGNCGQCKVIFNKDASPAGAPERIFLQ